MINAQQENRPVHTRKIEIQTYDLGENRILVEGKLADTRNSAAGGPESSPVLIHDLIARIWIQGPDFTIFKADAEMVHIPRNLCPDILPVVQKLVGMKIISGFTQKVKDVIGGINGCAHLTSLFQTLGPAAVQGYFAAYGSGGKERSLDNTAISRVIDSCHVWRKDGPYVRSLGAMLRKHGVDEA